ncbi:hypothetical protein [uncultured Desulfobacter sp.]|uniref:hypothetical protein n=1 Tax=uncultured Desulfobacter sp. TaxID=240139 RepID=UPI0029C795DC|nr:hypothetical protein [uncultured Desulfobacter sp.]
MNLIVFIHPEAGQCGAALRKAIRGLPEQVKTTWFSDFDKLEDQLNLPESFNSPQVYLLLMDTLESLETLSSMIPCFEDRRVLLVLPDQSPDTISRALKFRPRFFTGPSDQFDDLCAVIKKLL